MENRKEVVEEIEQYASFILMEDRARNGFAATPSTADEYAAAAEQSLNRIKAML